MQLAAAQLQQAWRTPQVADAEKAATVAAIQAAFRAELALQMKPPAETDDLLP